MKPRFYSESTSEVRTLVRWEKDGTIQAIKTPSGQRRYDIDSYTGKFVTPTRDTVIYARVSSRGQSEDLSRQIEVLKKKSPQAEVVSEIGGGLNFKRAKLDALLERVI
jgi:predicted site-specific integrase-resolvase